LSPAPIAFPVEGLSDGVVRLRLMAEDDVPAIVEAVQDPEIPRWTRVPDPYGEDDARQWHRTATTGIGAGTDLPTLIVDADDDRLLGAVGLHNLDPETGRCSAGYWVAAPERGRGVAVRALRLLCGYAFDDLGAQRIELWIEPANAPSLRVAEGVGFHREGLLRSFMPIREARRDMLMYSLLPGDLSRGAGPDRRR
jgi:RimJ/RimL family protein N-acetyltransferase